MLLVLSIMNKSLCSLKKWIRQSKPKPQTRNFSDESFCYIHSIEAFLECLWFEFKWMRALQQLSNSISNLLNLTYQPFILVHPFHSTIQHTPSHCLVNCNYFSQIHIPTLYSSPTKCACHNYTEGQRENENNDKNKIHIKAYRQWFFKESTSGQPELCSLCCKSTRSPVEDYVIKKGEKGELIEITTYPLFSLDNIKAN